MAKIKWPEHYVRFDKDPREEEFDEKFKAQKLYCRNLIEFDPEIGRYVKITHRYSFTAKLKQAKFITKEYYNRLKNEILAYQNPEKELRSETSFDAETFYYLKTELIKFTVMGRKIRVFFNFDPYKLQEKGYRYIKDVSMRPAYEKTPAQFAIGNDYKFNQALEIIDLVLESFGYTKGEVGTFDWTEGHPYKSLKYLVRNAFVIQKRRPIKEVKVLELEEAGKANVIKWKPEGFVVIDNPPKKSKNAPAPQSAPLAEEKPQEEQPPVVEEKQEEPVQEEKPLITEQKQVLEEVVEETPQKEAVQEEQPQEEKQEEPQVTEESAPLVEEPQQEEQPQEEEQVQEEQLEEEPQQEEQLPVAPMTRAQRRSVATRIRRGKRKVRRLRRKLAKLQKSL